jgi:hypothetical protein
MSTRIAYESEGAEESRSSRGRPSWFLWLGSNAKSVFLSSRMMVFHVINPRRFNHLRYTPSLFCSLSPLSLSPLPHPPFHATLFPPFSHTATHTNTLPLSHSQRFISVTPPLPPSLSPCQLYASTQHTYGQTDNPLTRVYSAGTLTRGYSRLRSSRTGW